MTTSAAQPPNLFTTSPEVLAEASPWSLSDLALMSPEEMSPAAELAYIAELRSYRSRYERALGAGATTRGAGGAAKATKARPTAAAMLDGPTAADEEGLF